MNVFHHAHLPPDPTAVVPPFAMADLLPVIETYEHRWMRAWVGRDSKALKSLTATANGEGERIPRPGLGLFAV